MHAVVCYLTACTLYRFDKRWLKEEYRDKRTSAYQSLTGLKKKVIDGVHTRDITYGLLADKLSEEDWKVLNRAYSKSVFLYNCQDFVLFFTRLCTHTCVYIIYTPYTCLHG